MVPLPARSNCNPLPSALRLHRPATCKAGKRVGSPLQQAAVGDPHQHPRRLQESRLHVFDRATGWKFLVDSGSTVSLLPKKFVSNKTTPGALTLSAANGSTIRTYGQHALTLNLGLRRAFGWAFVLADVRCAIIGADFLTHFGLIVDLKRRRLQDSTTLCSAEGIAHRTPLHGVSLASPQLPDDDFLDGRIKALLAEHSALFQPHVSPGTGPTAEVQHHIVTTGPPVFAKPRRLMGDKLAAAKQHFDLLLHQGTIRPSSSQWASPLHLIKKADSSWRISGDYRRLNSITVPDRYSMPRIEDLLSSLHGRQVFTKLDLNRAYFKIPVAPEDVPKTAVTTPFGLFDFLGMPLGLRNATQTFQRHMDNLFRHLPFVRTYLDDVLVASSSLYEHVQHLRVVFDVLANSKLTLNASKCAFAQSEVTFLGFRVSAAGFQTPPDRVSAIVNFTRPATIADLRRFTGVFNYYRTLILRAAQLQAPLTDLFKGSQKKKNKRPINWTQELIAAFDACKSSLAKATRMAFLAPGAPLILSTDVSATCLGAALDQVIDGVPHPLGFFSRKLLPAEKNYSPYDRELLAVFSALKHFEHILEGREFTVRTDHKPLVKALEQRPEKASPRQLRQLEYISQFCPTLFHIDGEDNTLSRIDPGGNFQMCQNV